MVSSPMSVVLQFGVPYRPCHRPFVQFPPTQSFPHPGSHPSRQPASLCPYLYPQLYLYSHRCLDLKDCWASGRGGSEDLRISNERFPKGRCVESNRIESNWIERRGKGREDGLGRAWYGMASHSKRSEGGDFGGIWNWDCAFLHPPFYRNNGPPTGLFVYLIVMSRSSCNCNPSFHFPSCQP